MRSLIKYLLILGVLSTLTFTSCKEDPVNPATDEFSTLSQYLVQQNLDMNDLLVGWVTSAGALNVTNDFAVPNFYVIDLRSAADFDKGHIKDAHNTALANVLEEAEKAAGKPILVVCYTGQTAGRAVGALKLMGYDARSLKWGMSAWHSAFAGKWDSNAKDVTSPNWVQAGDPVVNEVHGFPTIQTGFSDGPNILRERVRAMLQNSNWSIASAEVLANPQNYFINNKWSIDSWDAFGHISGAYRLDTEVEVPGLKWLDPTKTIVTYCYTGQTSAITTAWLNVLGYDARSLSFGANGIVHNMMAAHGSASKFAWRGNSSGSVNNFGYYDSAGTFYSPE